MAAAACLMLVVGCGASRNETAGTAVENARHVDPATAGEILGTITFTGVPPANAPISMSADPVCQRENPARQFQETYEVADGKLANVFVYIKSGLNSYAFDTPSDPVVIDQKGCRYHPHVFGIRVGQPLAIINSDPTLHNIHALPKTNPEFNFGQPIQGMKASKTFTEPEVMVPFKCDVHGWMNAYVGVVNHPFFAVTARDGTFSLKGVPPGSYVIEAWHEKLGVMTQPVTLAPSGQARLTFDFPATRATGTS